MSYKRCFIFGCSFTNYYWPTWASILTRQAKFPVYNLAKTGIGNVGIVHTMLDADLTYKFNDDDLIIVVWSHWSREDRFINGSWQTVGNIFNNSLYDKEFIKKYWDWDNDVIKNASAILLANRSFNINAQYTIVPYGDPQYSDLNEPRGNNKLLNRYLPHLPKIPVFVNDNSMFNNQCCDSHPDVLAHEIFYNTQVAPLVNLPVSSDGYFKQIHDEISAALAAHNKATEKKILWFRKRSKDYEATRNLITNLCIKNNWQ